jgi:hypothetical protein
MPQKSIPTFVALNPVILLIAASTHAQLQRPGQVACINALNKGGAKVAATQGKANTACIKTAGKGKEPDPDGCLTRDQGGKMAAAADKLGADFEKK